MHRTSCSTAMILVALGVGCSEAPNEGARTEEVEVEAEPTAAEPNPAEASAAEPAPAASPGTEDSVTEADEPPGEPLRLSIKESRLTDIRPAEGPPSLDARLEDGKLALHVQGLNSSCRRLPSLEARGVRGEVVIELEDTRRTRRACLGPHEMRLRIDAPAGGAERVRIVSSSGAELVSAEVRREG